MRRRSVSHGTRWAASFVLLGCSAAANAEIRVDRPASCAPAIALVLGAEFGTLSGVAKDTRDMKRALEAVGVETKLQLNPDASAARAALKTFAADRPDALHILYFAGAGGEEAEAPGRLRFPAGAKSVPPEDMRAATLAFDEIAAELGRDGQSSLIIVDSSLGDVRPRTERQVVLLAGDHGRADAEGGYFTQALASRLFEAAAGADADLLDVFRTAAAAARARSGGVEDPMLLVRGSSPDISVRHGALACTAPK